MTLVTPVSNWFISVERSTGAGNCHASLQPPAYLLRGTKIKSPSRLTGRNLPSHKTHRQAHEELGATETPRLAQGRRQDLARATETDFALRNETCHGSGSPQLNPLVCKVQHHPSRQGSAPVTSKSGHRQSRNIGSPWHAEMFADSPSDIPCCITYFVNIYQLRSPLCHLYYYNVTGLAVPVDVYSTLVIRMLIQIVADLVSS